jgi:hypothetical protein
MWRAKDPMRSWSRKPRPLAERFLEKVEVHGPEECWPWLGAVGRHGYGNIGAGDGRTLRAHRVSYTLTYGAIAEGLVVCHRCDNPRCVNPNHLFIASQATNLKDMTEKDRSARGERSTVAKLNDIAVLAIRAANARQIDLAHSFGVSPMTISLAKRRLTWRHLP